MAQKSVKPSATKVNKDIVKKPSSDNFKYVPDKKQEITKERLMSLLPNGSRHNITDEIIRLINNLENDTGLPQSLMEEEVYSYLYVLERTERVRLEDYINAVKFCNLKRNYTNEKAWSIVFPDRYARLKEEGKDIAPHVAMFNKTKLVQEIDKEMMIPFYLQYQTYAHAAIKKQFDLMNGRGGSNAKGEEMTVSPMVQHLAAKALFEMTAMPEEAKIDITVNKGEAEIELQKQMNEQLAQLVAQQKARLDAGESLSSVQKIGISVDNAIDVEVDE